MTMFRGVVVGFPQISNQTNWSSVMEWWRRNSDSIVSGVVIALLVGIVGVGWSMNSRLASVETSTKSTERRVDSIAQVLPDVRAKVAYETLFSGFPAAVLISQPHQLDAGWASEIMVWDAVERRISGYRVPLKSSTDKDAYAMVAGKAWKLDARPISFKKMAAMAVEVRDPAAVPNYVDAEQSFVAYVEGAQIAAFLKKVGYKQTASKADLPAVKSWKEFIEMVELQRAFIRALERKQ